MFRFVDEAEVWLHCDIKACDSRKFDCETICPNEQERKRREAFEEIAHGRSARSVKETENHGKSYQPNILTVGPMRSKERFTAESLEGGKQKYESNFLGSFKGFNFENLFKDIWAELASFDLNNNFYRSTSEH